MHSIQLFESKSYSAINSDRIISSPIPYMGNKKRLINKGLIRMFPNNINTFVDLFAGSGIVSMNTRANKIILNDIDSHLIELYYLFQKHSADEIILHIEKRIHQFGLAPESTKRYIFTDKEKIDQYKRGYIKLRDEYNKSKSVFDFCTLTYFSFSQQFRFNANGNFNMPYGNDYFSDYHRKAIINGCDFFNKNNVEIFNLNFKEFDISKLTSSDFVYLDPPYLITLAVYNENRNGYVGWSESDENYLYQLCESLNERNIKFGMSNVFSNKSKTNQNLIDWSICNNFHVHRFSAHTYAVCGKGNSMTEEVFITNYNGGNR